MLMILGVTAIVAGALLTAASGLLFRGKTLPAGLHRLIGGPSFGVLLATFMGLGLVMLFAFAVGDKSRDPIVLEAAIAVAIVVAGYVGVRLIAREAAKAVPSPIAA